MAMETDNKDQLSGFSSWVMLHRDLTQHRSVVQALSLRFPRNEVVECLGTRLRLHCANILTSLHY